MCRFLVVAFVALLVPTTLPAADAAAAIGWDFNDPAELKDWKHANHITELKISDGALTGRIANWDPFVRGPQFEIPATPYQHVEVKLKTDCDGQGDLYWSNTTDTPYGGFMPKKKTSFRIIGDGQWHVYRIDPYWHKEKKIILLRLDLPRPQEDEIGNKTFAIDYLRIVGADAKQQVIAEPRWDFSTGLLGWSAGDGGTARATREGLRLAAGDSADAGITSGPLRCTVHEKYWVCVEMKTDAGTAGYFQWVSSQHEGIHSAKFPVKADGQFHIYNIDLSSQQAWTGEALLLGLQPTNAKDAKTIVRKISLGMDPMGKADVDCLYLGLDEAIARAGRPATLVLKLVNRGGESTGSDLHIAELSLPAGVSVVDDGDWRKIETLETFAAVSHYIQIQSRQPIAGEVAVTLAGQGAPAKPLTGKLEFTQPLGLARADYVPEPRPVKSDYDIGAFYFPGWESEAKWKRVAEPAPERKPVLGWYEEGNPECVDWQIKWAVEHGINFFLVDWYWHSGTRRLEHWVNAFKQARYRRYLKWAMMWANHNRPGSHSEADMREVAKYWVKSYFNMPEYMRIDGKPVVMIWSPANLRRDLGADDGGKRALSIAREVAKEAGYPGIYFVAMKWPEASTDPALIRELANDGYDMTSIYHYMHHGDQAEDPMDFPFELCVRSSYDHWQSWRKADILPFLPNVSTGWDSRPWHGDRARVVRDRTVSGFRRICEDAKRFADETGIKRMTLGPLNEWGEGSYAEPNKEFGFGMYDTVRDVFCKKPAEGWPPDVIPSDVGRGPYDYPETKIETVTAWKFAESADGWSPMMGIKNFRHDGEAIQFETTSHDPALVASLHKVEAAKYPALLIRMKLESAEADDQAQLFWSTTTAPVSETSSVRFAVKGDGKYHDYFVALQKNSRWRGTISSFRLDPCSYKDCKVSIAEIRLSTDAN